MDTLVSQVQSKLPVSNGSWSVYICDLSGGSEATINDSPMQAASLIKLFIMGQYMRIMILCPSSMVLPPWIPI